MRAIGSKSIGIYELREKIREILKKYDTVFGRNSEFISKKIKERGYESLKNIRIANNLKEMRDVIQVRGNNNRVKWRKKEVIEDERKIWN